MPAVFNMRFNDVPLDAVYIGRPSKWGNPFTIGKDGTRSEVIQKFRDYLLSNSTLMADIGELRGRDLVCWCSPLKCHGDVLLVLANPTKRSLFG